MVFKACISRMIVRGKGELITMKIMPLSAVQQNSKAQDYSQKQTSLTKLNSRSISDFVNFGSASIPKTLQEQAKLISDFIGEPVNHERGWIFRSVKDYSLDEVEEIHKKAVEEMFNIVNKIGNYRKKEDVGECVATAYEYLLKTADDTPVWSKELDDKSVKTTFVTAGLPVGKSGLVDYNTFSKAMVSHINKAIKEGNNIINYNGQKYHVMRSYMSSGTLPDEFIGFDIGLVS